jgi:Cu(I)/Ag(I) efflux system protein CusF
MKVKSIAFLVAAASSIGIAHAQGMKGMDMKDMDMKGMDMQGMDKGGKKSQSKSHHAVGTVKSVDAAKGTVTLDHEPVASMNWPAMTMTFKAKDKKMLEGIKPGQKVEIDFEKHGKDYVVTKVK